MCAKSQFFSGRGRCAHCTGKFVPFRAERFNRHGTAFARRENDLTESGGNSKRGADLCDCLSKRKEAIVLLLCLLVGFSLRYYSFDKKSLWVDEIHTYNDSKDGLRDQIRFYRDNPAFLHPPLFFILTHQLFPFTHPERDLRIIPLVFGTFSILMIYLFSRAFSPQIAIPCTLSLTFMAYHISLSQDGRSYALLMFLATTCLYFFVKHLRTAHRRYLVYIAILFAALFHTSYSSIPFILFVQLLWFCGKRKEGWRQALSSFLILNILTLLLCSPWLLFVIRNYAGERVMDLTHRENPGSFIQILNGVLHDWVPHAPLTIASGLFLLLFPFVSRSKANAVILLGIFIFPIAALSLFCKISGVTHFVTSRYLVTFLPLFLISLYLSIDEIETRFDRVTRFLRLRVLFVTLFIASNILLLPLYYQSEKQDLRGLTAYLKGQLKPGDKIFLESTAYIPGILHYFGNHPDTRHHKVRIENRSENDTRYTKTFFYKGGEVTIHHSNECCREYVSAGNRLWIVTPKWRAKELTKSSPCVLKGYFDGSFLNFNKFPDDASIYLFLWDPRNPGEKGIEIPIE
jgi:hypothetical protein